MSVITTTAKGLLTKFHDEKYEERTLMLEAKCTDSRSVIEIFKATKKGLQLHY